MTLSLRDELDELEGYVSAVALASGIPVSHVEKDFWVTEALRGIADASQATGCSVIFKGGTSLSKAHRLIKRFSEDVDLLVVLHDDNGSQAHCQLALPGEILACFAEERCDSGNRFPRRSDTKHAHRGLVNHLGVHSQHRTQS